MKQILIATKNKGKVREFRTLFQQFGFTVKSLLDVEGSIDVVEDGETFNENAIKKAEEIAKEYDVPTVADDSGLIVDYLGGKPGVYSARYAGEEKDDEANLEKVLSELEGVAEEKRTARFHCSLAFAIPGRETLVVEGSCEGVISDKPIGAEGFGYDPIFYVPSKRKTMAQLSKEEKNELSHRANALKKLQQILEKEL